MPRLLNYSKSQGIGKQPMIDKIIYKVMLALSNRLENHINKRVDKAIARINQLPLERDNYNAQVARLSIVEIINDEIRP